MRFLKKHVRIIVIIASILITLTALAIFTLPNSNADNSGTVTSLKPLPGVTVGSADPSLKDTTLPQNSSTDDQIAFYQSKLKTAPNATSYAALGLAYLQKVREVSDPAYYTKAEAVFKQALTLDPNSFEAMGGMGSLSLSRHLFSEALVWGQKAEKLQPNSTFAYGVMNDALIELGRYDEAQQVLQAMVDLHPDISSYSRISYQRELHGQYDGAVAAMQMAVESRGPDPENQAWVMYQLGLLYMEHNQVDLAEQTFQQALIVVPNYVYANEGLARVKIARGDYNGALPLLQNVSERMPVELFIIELGDLYQKMGNTAEANRQYQLVRSIDQLYVSNGMVTDKEMALFNADHNYNLPEDLAKAQKAYQDTPSVVATDVLAWTYYKTGDYANADKYEKLATRLGTFNSLFLFHAGMIAAKLGHNEEARTDLQQALTNYPTFSLLYADMAKQTLQQLGGSMGTN